MKLIFIHADGRGEAVEEAAALRRVGGVPAHPAAVVSHLMDLAAEPTLEIWVTWHGSRVPRPPRRGAVLLVIGDEAGQIPEHAEEFVCVFSNGARSLGRLPRVVSAQSAWIAGLEGLRVARNFARRVQRRMAFGAALTRPDNLYSFPLGGSEIEPLAAHEAADAFDQRRWDVMFLGSIGRTAVLGAESTRVGLSPKSASRLAAAESLRQAQDDQDGPAILLGCADHPQFGRALSPEDYRSALGRTRICLCPRGNFVETFRHAEAARAGCIVMTDRLPEEWYFDGHPFIVVDDWSQAVTQAKAILANPNEAARLAEATREWYDRACRPDAVAAVLAPKITAHTERGPS